MPLPRRLCLCIWTAQCNSTLTLTLLCQLNLPAVLCKFMTFCFPFVHSGGAVLQRVLQILSWLSEFLLTVIFSSLVRQLKQLQVTLIFSKPSLWYPDSLCNYGNSWPVMKSIMAQSVSRLLHTTVPLQILTDQKDARISSHKGNHRVWNLVKISFENPSLETNTLISYFPSFSQLQKCVWWVTLPVQIAYIIRKKESILFWEFYFLTDNSG